MGWVHSNAHKVLVRKFHDIIEKAYSRWKDNIKTDVKETGWE